jgi:hypothetical protein
VTPLAFDVVAAVNDEETLARNLAASPAIASGAARLHVERGAPCMGVAYNRGLDATRAEIVVFAHQDVYLPASWPARLAQAIACVEKADPNWGVLGPFGVTPEGRSAGRVWCAANRGLIGRAVDEPVPVQSLDELILVLRRGSRLRFDEALPHFHFYGTDIVQQARVARLGAYAADLPVVHNSKPVATLDAGYLAGWRYMRRKWRTRLPIVTPVTRIDRFGLKLLRKQLQLWRSMRSRATAAIPRSEDPAAIAARCGIA